MKVKDIMKYIGEYERVKIVSNKTYVKGEDRMTRPFEFIIIETNKRGEDPEITWTTDRPKSEEAQKLQYDEIMEYEITDISSYHEHGDIGILLYVNREGEVEE